MASEFFEQLCQAVPKPRQRGEEAKSFWRKEDPVIIPEVLGAGGEIIQQAKLLKGGMWGPQRQWWDLPNFVKVLLGGYGAGKTVSLAKRAIALALFNAPAPVAVVSPTFSMARQTMVVSIRSLLQGRQALAGSSFWWKYNKSSHEFTIRYHGRNATILIYSGEDPDSLKGPNLAAAGIDEPFIQEDGVFHQMVARVRHPEAKHKEIFLGGTPEGLNSWGYDLCQGKLKEKHKVGIVRASTRTNLILGESYVNRLLSSFTGKAALAYVEGHLVNLSSGLVYYGFDPTPGGPNVINFITPEGAELGCGMDFNVDPMAAAIFWRAGNHVHIFDEIELPNADTELLCELLNERYVGANRVTRQILHEVYPDASGAARKTAAPQGKSDFSYIRDAGFEIRANSENPKRRDSWNAVNGKLAPKQGTPSLTISPSCTKLIKYMAIFSHEKMNKQKAMSHLLDAARYPVSYLFPVVRERAQVIQLDGF